ncbi:MAG: MopE-related protein [Kofleriaceae bacterium]
MERLCAWLGAATLTIVALTASARAGEPLKPYVVLILDTSGSMVADNCGGGAGTCGNPTGSGPPSCGGIDDKLNHAKCAIYNIVNSYGDMVFALARFRTVLGGSISGTFPAGCCEAGPAIGGTNGCGAGFACAGLSGNNGDHAFELLSPLVDGNNQLAASWTNTTANTCTASGSDPEIWDIRNGCVGGNGADGTCGGGTPLEGVLRGSQRYFLGQQATNGTTIIATGSSGFDPIRSDPTRLAFLPKPNKPATCNPNPTTCNNATNCTGNNCCCLEQCRPYVVILLTDGAESCGGDPVNGATALLTTDVDNRRYRVETRPIGFGIAPGNAQIENIAHAGGAADIAGLNEGFYASNEAELQLAISAILADAIKTESCNDLDDDCDGSVDEDFEPDKGNACDNGKLGVCRRTGNLVCKVDGTGLACNAPDANGSTEICNNLDDDCDGKVDEGLAGCSCSPQGEQCNNADEDCDGRIDEGITRPCGTGTCQGIETCTAGAFGGCTAQPSSTEVCNGLDDNCDGVRDGFTQECSTLPPLPPENFPVDDPRNNPGDPSNGPIPQNLCHPGTKVCPANVGPPNAFGSCLGEVKPRTEVCNGLDDDCDNKIDEGTGGADCSSNCGVGQTVCVAGQIQCNSIPALSDDTCDGNDDDCDGNIDEDYVCDNPPNCPCTASGQCNAVQSCVSGVEVCQGQAVSQESCDCNDNDCDGRVDEGSLCGAGATCTNCQCAFACSPGEFPCPLGKFCRLGFCIADPCFGVTCPPVGGNAQTCQVNSAGNQGMCVDACSVTSCAPLICLPATGACAADDCRTFPERCAVNESCVVNGQGDGECVTNLCQGITCPADQYCIGGQCHGSCSDVECPDGQRCRLGVCETDPCGHACPFGFACNDSTGECVIDACPSQSGCGQGQWCDPNINGGTCQPDPCAENTITCPNPTDVCRGGSCFDPADFLPDAGVAVVVTTGGGGGCATSDGGAGVLLVGFVLLLRRRRRPSRRPARPSGRVGARGEQ